MTPVQGQPSPMRYKQTIRKLEKYLQDAFAELGAKTYESAWKGELEAPALVPLVQKIENIIEAIDTNKQELEELQTARKVARGARCPYCGSPASSGARFCPGCGADMQRASMASATDVKRCPYCDVEMSADAEFCRSCGTRVEASTDSSTGEPPPTAAASLPPQVSTNVPDAAAIPTTPYAGVEQQVAVDSRTEDFQPETSSGQGGVKWVEGVGWSFAGEQPQSTPKATAASSRPETHEKPAKWVEGMGWTFEGSHHDAPAGQGVADTQENAEPSSPTCPHCGEITGPGAATCVNCGKSLR